jgi:hypothetical protein
MKRHAHKHTAQAAQQYLTALHPTGFGISPARFAAAANEQGTSFDQLMRYIARFYAGGAQSDVFRQQDLSAAAAAAGGQS